MTLTAPTNTPLDLRAPVATGLRKGSWWVRLVTLLVVDYSVLSLAWLLAESYAPPVHFPWYTPNNFLSILITVSIQIAVMALQGLYLAGKRRYDYLNIVKTLTFAYGLILLTASFYQPIHQIATSVLLFPLILSIVFVSFGRFAVNTTVEYLRKHKIAGCNYTYVICEPDEQEQALNFIEKENRYTIAGTENSKALDRANRKQTLAKLNELGVTEVFISWDAIKSRMFLCWLFQSAGMTVHILPMELKPIHRDLALTKIGGMPCLSFYCPLLTGKEFWIKRSFDFCFSLLFLAFTFPIYLAIALAIKLDSPGPVFFKQTRIGLHGKPFKAWKFRTMHVNAELMLHQLEALNENKDGILFKMKDDPRITRTGKFLRRYSLDELPQIFNVLFGEMSLIGPRPLPTRDVEKFSSHHFIRHEVLPGITGFWQVSGRSDIIDFEQVLKLDLHYIENWSLWLDLKILLQTVAVVLNKKGAY